MKKICKIIFFCTSMIFITFLYGQEEDKDVFKVPKIAVIDVVSHSFEKAEREVFTDILRTEIFKMQQFTILERGLIQEILQSSRISLDGMIEDSRLLEVGRTLSVDKLLICKIERLGESIVLNLRMIDVKTSMLDYTENIFITDENQVFQSLGDLVLSFKIYQQANDENLTPEKRREIITQNWIFLEADEEDLLYLSDNNINPADFMALRQYDITFTVKDYIAMLNNGWDRELLEDFFREGIGFQEIRTALQLGIGDLKNYRTYFKPSGLTFSEYLDAYRNNIISPAEYIRFRKWYKKDYLRIGFGGVADSLPILNASFSFFVIKAGWEHYITDFQRESQKYSIEMGSNFFMGYLPTPYFQANYYLGQHPFYGKISLGGVAEVLVGGHYGAYVCLGMELGSAMEFTVMGTFLGTQPIISYADFETKRGDPDYVDIEFPYIGVFFCYKLSDFSFLQ